MQRELDSCVPSVCTYTCVSARPCQRLSTVGGKYVLIIDSQGQTCKRAYHRQEKDSIYFKDHTKILCMCVFVWYIAHYAPPEWVQSALCVDSMYESL